MAEKKNSSKSASGSAKKPRPGKAVPAARSDRSARPAKPTKTQASARKTSKGNSTAATSAPKKRGTAETVASTKKAQAQASAKPAVPKTSTRSTSGEVGARAGKPRKLKAVQSGGRSAGRSAPSANSKPARSGEVERPLPKTHLTDKQLLSFKEMLLDKRRELLGDVRTLTKDALGRSRQDSSGDLSSMPIHMADLGTDNWEQDFTLGLIANEQQLVREIDEALRRIEERTYGICLVMHKPIGIARLKAKPWAKYCIEYARQRELGRF